MTKLQLECYLSNLNLNYYNEEELQEIYDAVKSTVDRIEEKNWQRGVTMFEKEAEEYATTGYEKKLLTKEQIEVLKCGRYDGFQKGAEFGYNKANEWHYIKDGNLPKENENVLIYSNRANHIGFYRNGFWFTNSDGCLEDDDIDVIAWKEIPKEIE